VVEKCVTITVKKKPALQPKFEIVQLSPSKTTITEGEPLNVGVWVKNTGNAGGTVTVKLKIDDTVKAQKSIYIDPGSFEIVSFHISGLSAGTHTICAEI